MPRRQAAIQVVRAGNVSIPIYKTSKGFMARWMVGGNPNRIDRVKLANLVEELKEVAAKLASGSAVVKAESVLLRDLTYYRGLEVRMGDTPIHIAVDAWLLTNKSRPMKPAKVSALLPEYLADIPARGHSSAYCRVQKVYLGKFAAAFGAKEIHTILTDEISSFLGGIAGLRYRKNIRGAVVTFFRWSRDKKKALPPNLMTEAEHLNEINVKRKQVMVYTPDELRRMLDAATGELRDVIVLGALCGLRASEITGEETDHPPLPKEAILFDFDQVRVGEQKVQSKGNRFAPLLPAAKKWLAHLNGKTGPVWTGRKFEYHLKKICKAAGVDFIRNGLRKSWITYRMAIVKNAHQVADEGGNSPSEIFKSYRRPELIHVAEGWFATAPASVRPGRFSSTRGVRRRKK